MFTRFAGLLLLMTGLVLGACQRPEFQYVKSYEAGTVFKVPHDWTLFPEDEVLGLTSANVSPLQRSRLSAAQWAVAFDSSPDPSLANVLNNRSRYPTGLAHVRVLTDAERDNYSFKSMRNEIYPIDQLASLEGWLQEVDTNEIVLEKGYRGIEQIYTMRVQSGGFYTFRQISLVDPGTQYSYVFVIGCEANCYEQNKEVINEVAESWTIEEF